MEQLLAVLAGAVAVAVSPLVPGVRPVAKAFVKGSLAMADVVAGSAVVVGQQWEHLMAHVGPEKKSGAETTMGETRTGAEGATVAAPSAAAEGVEPDAEPQAAAQPAVTVAAPTVVADSQAAVKQAEPPADARQPEAEDAPAPAAPPPDEELLQIDGIGPKVAGILVAAGITTLDQLAIADEERLRAILAPAGARYRAMNPASWPDQARQLLS